MCFFYLKINHIFELIIALSICGYYPSQNSIRYLYNDAHDLLVKNAFQYCHVDQSDDLPNAHHLDGVGDHLRIHDVHHDCHHDQNHVLDGHYNLDVRHRSHALDDHCQNHDHHGLNDHRTYARHQNDGPRQHVHHDLRNAFLNEVGNLCCYHGYHLHAT